MNQSESRQNLRIGFFTLLGLLILAYATIRVSDRNLTSQGTYIISVVLSSGTGLTKKTPVQIAGIQVGYVSDLELIDSKKAKVVLKINKEVQLSTDVTAQVRTKGFLGETYIDLLPGSAPNSLSPGSQITAVNPYVDLSQLTQQLHEIASDVKVVTDSMKRHFAEGGNWDQIMYNFAQLSEKLNYSLGHVSRITKTIDEGKGTIGRLVHDEETVENLNQAAKGLSETLGGVNRFQTTFDYHVEYLGDSRSLKNYVGLELRPRPDKAFMLEFIVDPDPSAERKITTTDITTGGATTEVISEQRVVVKNKLLISAQLAKSFHNLTIRGGVIESTGGVGLDYRQGPFGVAFSAFDFKTDHEQRPHLKVLGKADLTRNFFLVSGVDDFISKLQDPDWFIGAGFQVVDEDIKSIFGVARLR